VIARYHIIWIPKYRMKVLYGDLRKYLGEVLSDLAQQKESKVQEGHLIPDHVHMFLSILPKYAVAQVSPGFPRNFGNRRKNFTDRNFGHEDTLCQHAVKMMKK